MLHAIKKNLSWELIHVIQGFFLQRFKKNFFVVMKTQKDA